MMDKPSYILDVEKTEGILSVMEIPYSVDKKYDLFNWFVDVKELK
jgi:hypothetical protein